MKDQEHNGPGRELQEARTEIHTGSDYSAETTNCSSNHKEYECCYCLLKMTQTPKFSGALTHFCAIKSWNRCERILQLASICPLCFDCEGNLQVH